MLQLSTPKGGKRMYFSTQILCETEVKRERHMQASICGSRSQKSRKQNSRKFKRLFIGFPTNFLNVSTNMACIVRFGLSLVSFLGLSLSTYWRSWYKFTFISVLTTSESEAVETVVPDMSSIIHSSGICHINKVHSTAWLYPDGFAKG